MRRLVLASTSPHRRALLERLGLPFEAAAPDFTETVAGEEPPPLEVARRFAAGKARSLAASHGDALLIGSDQTLEIDGRRLRKPADLEEAVERLLLLSGRTHALHSAVAVHDAASGATEVEATTVTLTLRTLDRAAVESYVRREPPWGSVGGYHFEGLGVALFEDVSGSDDSAIVGLPLLALGRLLRRVGVDPLHAAG